MTRSAMGRVRDCMQIMTMNKEIAQLPWEGMESYQLSGSLYRLAARIAKRWRKRLPRTARELRDASSNIGGKLARSCVDQPLPGTAVRQLRDRHRALKRAHAVRRRLELLRRWDPGNTDIMAAVEIMDRLIHLIRIGK